MLFWIPGKPELNIKTVFEPPTNQLMNNNNNNKKKLLKNNLIPFHYKFWVEITYQYTALATSMQ